MLKKFFVLYKAPIEEFQKIMAGPKAEMEKDLKEWGGWMKKHQTALADGGAPLGKTKEVTTEGVHDTRNDIGGYSIVQAESFDDAAKLFNDNPHFKIPRARIEVMEIMPMPA